MATEDNVLSYFVRHGETVLNAENCYRGSMNPELNANGRQEAHLLAKYFNEIPLSAIAYSDRKRSTETAAIIASKHEETPMFGSSALYAWDVGKFSGQPKSPENKKELEIYVTNPDIPIPQGESLNEFKARIHPCIREALEIGSSGKPTMVVVHSSVIHELGSYINGDNLSSLVEPGGVAAVYYDPEDGHLIAKAIHRPVLNPPTARADQVS